MSYAVPAAPGERRRPALVTATGIMLYVAAVLSLINALLPLPSMSKIAEAAREAYAGSTNPTPDEVALGYKFAVILIAVIGIVGAILYVVLGTLNLRGNRVSRILTWVVTGLGLICFCCLAGGGGYSNLRFNNGTTSGGVDPNEAARRINAARPSWLTPVTLPLSVIGVLLLILVIIFLALPASNAYFRSPNAAQPQMGYPNYPPTYPNVQYPPIGGDQSGGWGGGGAPGGGAPGTGPAGGPPPTDRP